MRKTIPTTSALILIFRDTQNYFKRPYSFLSIETMREKLKTLHGIDISYAGVRKQLVKLKNLGLLITFPPKFGRRKDGTIYAKSPNRSLTFKGLRWLVESGVAVAKACWDHVTGKKKMPRVTEKDIARIRAAAHDFKDKSLSRVAGLLPSIGESFT